MADDTTAGRSDCGPGTHARPVTGDRPDPTDAIAGPEAGMTTAELLGNAALGVLALVALWAALGGVGQQVIDMISDALVRR